MFYYLKNAIAYYNAGIVVVNLKMVGLDPGLHAVKDLLEKLFAVG
jgi:hypothetical protein